MMIFFNSYVSHQSAYFIHTNFLKLKTNQQTIIALIALTILSSLSYYFIRVRSGNIAKVNNGEANLFNQVTEQKQVKLKNDKKDKTFDSFQPKSAILDKILLPNDTTYDFYTEDLKDKKWKEEGKAAYRHEMKSIKTLRKKLHIFQGSYDQLLQQYPQYQNVIERNLNHSCVPSLYRESYHEQFKRVIYEALTIREVYQTTHYTFLHGRALSWRTFSYFTKKLIQAFRPTLKINGIDFIRAPFRTHAFQNAHEFLNHCSAETINDHQTFLREQLIAVDAFWLNQFPAESALYFFGRNASTSLPHSNTYRPLIEACFHAHTLNKESFIHSIIEKIQNICLTLQDELWKARGVTPGELIVICIPKAMIKDPTLNPIYRSQARGVPASNPKESIENIALLEKLQQNEVLPEMEMTQIQYRLLTSHLTPKNGVRIFGINALSKRLKNIYKEPIQKLVKEILAITAQ